MSDGDANADGIQGLPLTAKLLTHEDLLSVSGQLECEPPNTHLYEFAGNIRLTGRQLVHWHLFLLFIYFIYLPAFAILHSYYNTRYTCV